MTVILVSACLLGVRCTWRGTAASASQVERFQAILPAGQDRGVVFLPVCPEQLGGLPTPRPPAELQASAALILSGGGRVKTRDGVDCTPPYRKGAEEVRRLANLTDSRLAVLRDRSPACGVHAVHAGFFSGALTAGQGVAAAALREDGITLLTVEEFLAVWRWTDGRHFPVDGWVYAA